MSSPIYFFPRVSLDQVVKANRLDQAFLAARGVASAFIGVTDVAAQASCWDLPAKGPGGNSGLLLTVVTGGAPKRLGFYPDFQTWHERPAGCDCWVGLDNESPPTPADLAHVATPQGYPIELGDGNTWRVPIVRSPFGREAMGRSQLQQDWGYDADGKFQPTIAAAAAELWELSGQAWDHCFQRDAHATIDFELVLRIGLMTLAVNYRVGKVEQQLLKLINNANWEEVIQSLLDVPLVEAMQEVVEKKTESGVAS